MTKSLFLIIAGLIVYIAATKTKVSVQPEVHTKTRFLPRIIKLPEVDVVPVVNVTIAEEPQEEPGEPVIEEAVPEPEVAAKSSVELYTQPQLAIQDIRAFDCPTCNGTGIFHGAMCPTCDGASNAITGKPTAAPSVVQYYCGPNGCYSYPVQAQPQYRTYQQPRGFRPIRRLFGRR